MLKLRFKIILQQAHCLGTIIHLADEWADEFSLKDVAERDPVEEL